MKEIEAFIQENALNERAGEALRGAQPAVQWQVLEQVGSRFVVSCLRRHVAARVACGAAENPAQVAAGQNGAKVEEPPRHWQNQQGTEELGPSNDGDMTAVIENLLDERAATALRTSAPWLQRQVLDQALGNLGWASCLRRAQQIPGAGQVQSHFATGTCSTCSACSATVEDTTRPPDHQTTRI
eukprot:Skav231705  [mRNA]  locus=scaffold1306:77453:79621:- [translate_table: standard]